MPMNQLEIENATFRVVMQWLNQLSPRAASSNVVQNISKDFNP